MRDAYSISMMTIPRDICGKLTLSVAALYAEIYDVLHVYHGMKELCLTVGNYFQLRVYIANYRGLQQGYRQKNPGMWPGFFIKFYQYRL